MEKSRKKISSSSSLAPPSEITHHFFKVYLPSFSLHNLKIPTTFIKKLNGVVSEKAILKDPLERLWHVEVKKVKGTFYFLNGWKEFVKYNCLKVGEFLVFSYVGKSVFYVDIFDNSGCEKEDSLVSVNNNINITTKIITPPLVKKEVELEGDVCFTKNLNKTTTTSVKEEVKSANETSSNSVRWPSKGEDCEGEIYRSKRSAATNGEIEEISNPVGFIESKLPHFVAFVKKAATHSLYIPSKLVTRDDINIKPKMVLRDPSRRSWPVTICFLKDRTVIGKGWWAFLRGNNLIPGDKCIFEFNKCKVRGRSGRGRGRNSNVINVKFVRATGKRSSAPHKTRSGTALVNG